MAPAREGKCFIASSVKKTRVDTLAATERQRDLSACKIAGGLNGSSSRFAPWNEVTVARSERMATLRAGNSKGRTVTHRRPMRFVAARLSKPLLSNDSCCKLLASLSLLLAARERRETVRGHRECRVLPLGSRCRALEQVFG
jgi:hypothetical protein